MSTEMARGSQRRHSPDLVVRNPFLIFRFAVIGIPLLVAGIYYGLPGVFQGPTFLGALSLVMGTATCLVCRAQFSGIVVSERSNTVEFFGGGIAANSPLDFVRWWWLSQAFRRFEAPLDEVLSARSWQETSLRPRLLQPDRKKWATQNFVEATFPFGAVKWDFANNEAKADQLMQIFRIVNRMGTNAVFEA